MKCGACAKLLPVKKGGGGTGGRQRRCCDTERCKRIYYSGHQRTKCLRCTEPLPKGRQYQRLAVCMRCVEEIVDILGLERLEHAA